MENKEETHKKKSKLKKFLPMLLGISLLTLIVVIALNVPEENMLVGIQSISDLQNATGCLDFVSMEDISKCIGEHSTLYVQLGCVHCETQKKLFGEYYSNLNIIDCFYEGEKCGKVTATPTWAIRK